MTLVTGSYPSAEMKSVYYTAPADWAGQAQRCKNIVEENVKWEIQVLLGKEFHNN